jgi:hypothetical protein
VDVFGGLCNGGTKTCSGATVNVGTPSGTPTVQGAGWTASLSVPKFDQTDSHVGYMYALSAVNLTLDWVSQGSLSLLNLSCYGVGNADCTNIAYTNAQASVGATLTVGGVTVFASGNTSPQSGTAKYGCFNDSAGTGCAPGSSPGSGTQSPSNNGAYNFGVSTGGPYTVLAGLSGSGSTGNNASDMSFFEGFGYNTFSGSVVNSQGSCGPTGVPGLTCTGNANTGAFLVVTYTYSEVAAPEPMTFTLAGGSLLGLGLVARKRRSKKA